MTVFRPGWWNWQTRMLEGHMVQTVGVQISLPALLKRVIPIVQAQERRRYIRFSGRWLIHYSPLDKQVFEETYTNNFSVGGFAFETTEQIPAWTPLRLKVRISEHLAPIEVIGTVVRSSLKPQGGGFTTVIRLTDATDQGWERLVNWARRYSFRRSIM